MISHRKGLNRTLVTASVIVVIGLVLFPLFAVTTQNPIYYMQLISIASCSAILTISLNICMGYGGLLSLMHTGIQMVGGYTVAILVVKLGWSVWLALILTPITGALFSTLVILLSLRATYLYFGIITLAMNLIAMEFMKHGGEITGGENGLAGFYPPGISVESSFSNTKWSFYYLFVLLILFVAYIIQRNIIFSGFGRSTMALRESSETATSLGISPKVHRVKVFAISGSLAGIAGGMLSTQLGQAVPQFGDLSNGLIFFVGLFLGGVGTLAGPLVGVSFIALVDFSIRGTAQYRSLILGTLLLLCMVTLPRGIVGTFRASKYGSPQAREVDPSELDQIETVFITPTLTSKRGEVILEAKNVVKHFGGVWAVDGISVKFKAGEIHGIIGPNGSGKSTLVSCLTRYHVLTDGEVFLHGEVAPKKPFLLARKGVTRVFQIPHLFERVSVINNVLTGMGKREKYTVFEAIVRAPRYVKASRANLLQSRALLALAGLLGKEDIPAGSISYGQKRLLEVIRGVATSPSILILDEPATGLTQDELESLTKLVRTLADRGICVILIEHNVQFLMDLAEIVTVLQSGKVIAEGTPSEIQKNEKVLDAYLGRIDLSKELA